MRSVCFGTLNGWMITYLINAYFFCFQILFGGPMSILTQGKGVPRPLIGQAVTPPQTPGGNLLGPGRPIVKGKNSNLILFKKISCSGNFVPFMFAQ